jgi:predicted anti-sigma-YlaC factor YlaD
MTLISGFMVSDELLSCVNTARLLVFGAILIGIIFWGLPFRRMEGWTQARQRKTDLH